MRKLFTTDLWLVSIWGILAFDDCFYMLIPVLIILLRFLVSIFLYEKRKGSWLPILFFTVMMGAMTFDKAIESSFFNPLFNGFRAILLFLGYSDIANAGSLPYFIDVVNDKSVAFILAIFSLLFYFWILLFPIVIYVRQLLKKDFEVYKVFDKTIVFSISYLIIIVAASLLFMEYIPLFGFSEPYLLIFLLAMLPLFLFMLEKRLPDENLRYFFAVCCLFFVAFKVGVSMPFYLTVIGLITFPFVYYYLSCRLRNIRVEYTDVCAFLLGGAAFWLSQYVCGFSRFLFLAVSVLAFGYETWGFYRKVGNWKSSLRLFVVTAFLLPLLTIGYNVYSLPNSRLAYKFTGYAYSPNGVMVTTCDGKYGLRDRFSEIIPCEYDFIEMGPDVYKPFVKVCKDGAWGIYNIENHKMSLGCYFNSISAYSDNFYQIKMDNSTYYFPIGLNFRDSTDAVFDLPLEELANEGIVSRLSLGNNRLENYPLIMRIFSYLMSTYYILPDTDASAYMEWAGKVTKVINDIAEENVIFTNEKSSVRDQAIMAMKRLVALNNSGNQPDLNYSSSLYTAIDLYESIDTNFELVDADLDLWNTYFIKEYELWFNVVFDFNSLQLNHIYKEQFYSALPMDLNGFIQYFANVRRDMINENILMLTENGEIAYDGKNYDDSLLEGQIDRFGVSNDSVDVIASFRQSMLDWLHYRDMIASKLGSEIGMSYSNQTKKVRSILFEVLKMEADSYTSFMEIKNDIENEVD